VLGFGRGTTGVEQPAHRSIANQAQRAADHAAIHAARIGFDPCSKVADKTDPVFQVPCNGQA
jgi:hypothetical protein